MKPFTVLAKKEWIQFVRELKAVWLPLVFILLGISQPVVNYYLPSILKAFGGEQGIIVDPRMITQEGGQVLASTLGSQFDQLGVIIIVVAMMGIVQSDKANGMLAFILTRPVTIDSYIRSKIISNYLFVASSVTLGYIFAYMYTAFLFTSIHFIDLIAALLLYLFWVLFIVSFTTMISTIFNSQASIALLSIVVLLGIRMVTGFTPLLDRLNPASMSEYAMEMLVSGTFNSNAIMSILSTLLLSALAIHLSKIWISHKKFNTG